MIRKAAMLLLGMALVVSTVYADPAPLVTGGGNILRGPDHETLSVSLSCNPQGTNNLMLSGDLGDFRLDTLASACTISGSTITGYGTGTFNGVPNTEVSFSFTDDGKVVDFIIQIVPVPRIDGHLPGIQFHK